MIWSNKLQRRFVPSPDVDVFHETKIKVADVDIARHWLSNPPLIYEPHEPRSRYSEERQTEHQAQTVMRDDYIDSISYQRRRPNA
jgi:hypothetical protein